MAVGNMLLRLKRFEATEKARKVALLEAMIRDFGDTAVDLAQQIMLEEERTRIKDARHVAYSTFAKATALRRRNLLISVANLKPKLDAAKRQLDEVTKELSDLELAQNHAPSIYVAA
jgi:flagellar FliJ protein